MNYYNRFRSLTLCALGLLAIAGCNPEQKVVARINGENLPEEEFNQRTQLVTQVDPRFKDAGGMTLANMITDKVTEQLAVKDKAVPDTELVRLFTDYQLKTEPQQADALKRGVTNRADLERQTKFGMLLIAIGTNGDKPNDAEVQKSLNDKTFMETWAKKSLYHVRLLPVPTEAQAKSILTAVSKSADFAGELAKYPGIQPNQIQAVSSERVLPAQQLPPALKLALDSIKGTGYTPAPVPFQTPGQNPAKPQTIYIVAQLINKETFDVPPKLVRYQVEQNVLMQSHPDFRAHYAQQLNDYLKTADIHVSIKRYEPVVASIRDLFESQSSGMTSPAGGPQAMPNPHGASSSAPRSMQQNAPPTGGSPAPR